MNSAPSVLKQSVVGLLSSVLWLSASAQIEVVSNGNVGIGTTTPTAKLEVAGSGYVQLNPNDGSLELASGNDYYSFVDFRGSSNLGSDFRGRIGYEDGYGFDFSTAGTFVMQITEAGKVGIGTTNPGAKLQILDNNGFVRVDSGRLEVWYGNTESGPRVALNQNIPGGSSTLGGGIYWGTGGPGHTVANTGAGIGAPDVATSRVVSVFTSNGSNMVERMRVDHNGYVGIGTTNPGYKLEVAGTVRATSFVSNTTTYADFVFKPGYRLAPLSEVEAHIAKHGHLPGIPSEAEATQHGIDLAAMQVKLLQKVEEMTLHLIRLEKENSELRQEMTRMQAALLE